VAKQAQKEGEGFKKVESGGGGPEGGGGQKAMESAKKAIKTSQAIQSLNHVVYGANDVDLDLAGHTVAQVEEALADILNMEPGAEAYVDGKVVENKAGFKLEKGQRLEFMKESGQKGA